MRRFVFTVLALSALLHLYLGLRLLPGMGLEGGWFVLGVLLLGLSALLVPTGLVSSRLKRSRWPGQAARPSAMAARSPCPCWRWA